jgi:hypothetical protein
LIRGRIDSYLLHRYVPAYVTQPHRKHSISTHFFTFDHTNKNTRDMADTQEGKPARYRSQRKPPPVTSTTATTTPQTTTDPAIGRSRSRYHKTRPGAPHAQEEQEAPLESTKEPAIFPTRTRSTRDSRRRNASRDADPGALDSGDDGYGSMRSQPKSLEQAKASLKDDPMAVARAYAPTQIRAKREDYIPPQEEGDVSAEDTAGCFGLFGRKKKKKDTNQDASKKSANYRPATTKSQEPPVIRPGGGGIVPMTDAPLSAPNGASERRVSLTE